MSKIMIINWKFDPKNIKKSTNDYTNFQVEKSNDQLVCCNYDNLEKFNSIVEKFTKSSDSDFLIMLHGNNPNRAITQHNIVIGGSNGNVITHSFKGGSEEIYYVQDQHPLGLLDDFGIVDLAINSERIRKDYFDFVWEHYWNIQALLTVLAIDILEMESVKSNKSLLNQIFKKIKSKKYLSEISNKIEINSIDSELNNNINKILNQIKSLDEPNKDFVDNFLTCENPFIPDLFEKSMS